VLMQRIVGSRCVSVTVAPVVGRNRLNLVQQLAVGLE
jgi:hypothetical protein